MIPIVFATTFPFVYHPLVLASDLSLTSKKDFLLKKLWIEPKISIFDVETFHSKAKK